MEKKKKGRRRDYLPSIDSLNNWPQLQELDKANPKRFFLVSYMGGRQPKLGHLLLLSWAH